MISCLFPKFIPSVGFYVPCGRCVLCQKKKAFDWSVRLLHQVSVSSYSWFITLTYDEDNVPDELSLRDSQLFFKRLRKHLSYKIKYFCSFEYGDQNKRPHIHSIVFDLLPDDVDFVRAAWTLGFVDIKPVVMNRIFYISRYCMKKSLNHKSSFLKDLCKLPIEDRLELLDSQKLPDELIDLMDVLVQPFSTMSKKPGIGYDYCMSHKEQFLKFGNCSVNGRRVPLPGYYMHLLKNISPEFAKLNIKITRDRELHHYYDLVEKGKVRNLQEFKDYDLSVARRKASDIMKKTNLFLQKKEGL